MTLQLLHSEFSCKWGKFDFLFFPSTDVLENRVVVKERDVSPHTPLFSTGFGTYFWRRFERLSLILGYLHHDFYVTIAAYFTRRHLCIFQKWRLRYNIFIYLHIYCRDAFRAELLPKLWEKSQPKAARYGIATEYCRQSARPFLQSSELGPPTPSPAGERVPSLWFRGWDTLAGEGVGGPNSNEGFCTFWGLRISAIPSYRHYHRKNLTCTPSWQLLGGFAL